MKEDFEVRHRSATLEGKKLWGLKTKVEAVKMEVRQDSNDTLEKVEETGLEDWEDTYVVRE